MTAFTLHRDSRSLLSLAESICRNERVGLAVRATDPDPFVGHVRLIAIALSNGEIHVVDCAPIGSIVPLVDALQTVTVVGHDLQAPLRLLRRRHAFRPTRVFDTMLAAKLLDAGVNIDSAEVFTLDAALAKVFGNQARTTDNLLWHGPLTSRHVADAAGAVQHALALADHLAADLSADGLDDVARLECELLPVVVEIQLNGVAIDAQRWNSLVREREAVASSLAQNLKATLGVDKLGDAEALRVALGSLGIDVEKTNSEALAPFIAVPAVRDLIAYRSTNSFVEGPGRGVVAALARSQDGRVHATFDQLGAATGRMSAHSPNVLGLPRDPAVRGAIVAEPGNVLIVLDYSCIELRVLADRTLDPRLLDAFQHGDDPHRTTAACFAGTDPHQVTPEQREAAKPFNFGSAYAMGAPKLALYALKQFGVVVPIAEAERRKQAFLDEYERVADWQCRMRREMPGVVRTASGRARCFPNTDDDYPARLATEIQGTAADGFKQALVLLAARLPTGARIVLVVHDEIIIEAPERMAEQVVAIASVAMNEGMGRYTPNVPIRVDHRIGRTWAKSAT